MKKKDFSVSVDIYETADELPDETAKLVEKAKEAAQKAYAPYSGFRVGAAVELENGEIITGSNQENAAYPSGLCAERVAVFYAKAKYPDVPIKQLAVTALKDGETVEKPASPCGACRQVLVEYEDRQGTPLSVIIAGKNKIFSIERSADLLPISFSSKDLK